MAFRAFAASVAILVAVASAPAPSRAQNTAPYVVGAILSLSGSDAAAGLSMAAGLDVAVRHIDATGGIAGHTLQVRVLDDGGSAERAVQMMHRLIDESNVVAIVGPNQSTTAQALEPAANDAHVPLLSLAPAPPGTSAVLPWVFRFYVPEEVRIGLLVDYAKRHGLTRLGVMYSDNDYGRSAAALGTELSAAAGLTIVDREPLTGNDQTADGAVLRARDKGTQALLAFVDEYDGVIVAKSMSGRAPALTAVADVPVANLDFLHAAGKAAGAWRVASPKVAVPDLIAPSDPLYATIRTFAGLCRGGMKPDGSSGSARDAVTMLAGALGAAGADRDQVRTTLESGKPFTGVMGVYHMSAANHAAVDAAGLTLVQGERGAWKTAN